MCFHCQEELSVYINLAETKKINSVFNGSQRFLEKVLQHRLSLSLELFLCLRPFVPQLPPFLFDCKTINVFKEHAVQKCSAKLGPFFSPCWQWQAFESTFERGHLHHFCLFHGFGQYLVWGFIQCSFFLSCDCVCSPHNPPLLLLLLPTRQTLSFCPITPHYRLRASRSGSVRAMRLTQTCWAPRQGMRNQTGSTMAHAVEGKRQRSLLCVFLLVKWIDAVWPVEIQVANEQHIHHGLAIEPQIQIEKKVQARRHHIRRMAFFPGRLLRIVN